MHIQRYQSKKGYIALLSVLVLGAVAASLAFSLFAGSGRSDALIATEVNLRARGYAESCAEEALENIRTTTSYTGTNTLSWSAGSCTATVAAGTGENRTITVTGLSGGSTQHLTITLTAINPLLVISSWQDL